MESPILQFFDHFPSSSILIPCQHHPRHRGSCSGDIEDSNSKVPKLVYRVLRADFMF